MCVATVTSGIALAGTVMKTIDTVYSGVESYNNAQDAAQAAADANVAQAEYARFQANEALTLANNAEASNRLETQGKQGALAAKMGASNVQLNSGTPLDMLSDVMELGEVDALDIRDKGQSTAKGLWDKSNTYLEQANSIKSPDLFGSILGIGSSTVSGLGNIALGAGDFAQRVSEGEKRKNYSLDSNSSTKKTSSKSSQSFGKSFKPGYF